MSQTTRVRERISEILGAIRALAVEYYELTGRPLGVTGEVAEHAACEHLGLELAPARTQCFDALRTVEGATQRVQIKGRAHGDGAGPGQRLGAIKRGSPCDTVLLVLLDRRTLEPREMWEAPMSAVEERLGVPGSKARDRGSLSIREFKRVASKVWPSI